MPLTDNDPEVQILRHNLTTLLNALRAHSVSRVQVRYEGARGRCRLCAVSLLPCHSGTMLATQVSLQRLTADAGTAPVASFEDHTDLGEGLKRFSLHWASLQHGHWQRGDGGRGVMRLDVATGRATLDHDALNIEQFHTTLKV